METQKHTIDGWLKNITAFKTHRILLRQEGRHMYMHNLETKQTIRYNFKENQLEVCHYKTKEWNYTSRPYKFFRGFEVDDLVCPQAKLKVLIKYTKKLHANCHSLATLFNRMEDVMIYENYIEQRVKHELPYMGHRGYISGTPEAKTLKEKLKYYPKNFVQLCKETGYEISRDTEKVFNPEGYDNHAPFIKKVCDMLVNTNLYSDQKLLVLQEVISTYESTLEKLESYGYDLRTTLDTIFNVYIRNEGLSFNESATLLKDYYRMARVVKKHAEKYPKYLKSVHDIVLANFGAYEEERRNLELAESQDKEVAEDAKYWEKRKRHFLKYKGNADFVITIPQHSLEVIQEGTDLSHCVASYVRDIREGRTYIFFLRDKKTPFKSSITLEYKEGGITQARGDCNRALTWAEHDFLLEYCKLKKITLGEYISKPHGERPDVKVNNLTVSDDKKYEEWYAKEFEKFIKAEAKEDKKTKLEVDNE